MVAEVEDAPDLYRISALGLYEGELEPEHRDNNPSSEGEDQFDDEDADMDYMDEGAMLGNVIVEIRRDTDTLEGDHDDKDEEDEDGNKDEDNEYEEEDHNDHNADLAMKIADCVGGSIGL
ncbi:hypothetical protein BY996DRAFT_6556400 [Phakopsora pachyrhizi]|uniref:Uncharacterized protein n=1 Tax=Phakopsora pachyrhizi TaxID=170000 RepID=A0AAV0BGE6_PHAPC|nr:hypothetical protein BY996DRAFT_6556400 [Phakopsora pachyrhizi]CAH7686373.1 hypothetical protein PPACK8108_LOCUS21017 [Phakopsora pachyrhizi]